jgi:hypothetical protein
MSHSSAVTMSAAATADREDVHSRTPARPEPNEVPATVAGPSFLGLSDPPGGDSGYLLEDESQSRHGLRNLVLLVVLAAIVGLIFVQYRSSLKGNPKPPQVPNPSPANIPGSEGKNRSPDKGLQTAAGALTLGSAVASLAKAPTVSPKPDARPVRNRTGKSREQDTTHSKSAANLKSEPAVAGNDEPSPTLVRARQYLHGQGVRQNCEQGLIYLRAAARENDPQAAVQMGALYSSGVCVARDRVKAYEWFSTARDLLPDNHWIAKNLTQLWAEMTPEERQQIHPIKRFSDL